jgi:hypothetical protein
MVKLKFKRRPVRQNIFNLNRGKPLRFVSSGHTAPTFGSFLQIPKPNFNRSLLKQPALSFYGDSDGDGVMNGFDCAPYNKRKQGPQHKKYKTTSVINPNGEEEIIRAPNFEKAKEIIIKKGWGTQEEFDNEEWTPKEEYNPDSDIQARGYEDSEQYNRENAPDKDED